MTLPKPIAHVLNLATYYTRGVIQRFLHEDVFLWCGAIAFKMLIAFVPLTFLAVGIFGIFLKREELFFNMADFIRTFLPNSQSEQLIQAMLTFAGASSAITVIGAIGLLVVAITLFSTLRVIVGNVFGPHHQRRSIVRGYMSDLRMGLLTTILFGLTVLVQYLRIQSLVLLATSGAGETVQGAGIKIISLLGLILPFVIVFLLFFLMYYFTPCPRPNARSAVWGALVTSILWEVAKNAFTIYAQYLGRFDRYENMMVEDGSITALGEVFGLVLAFVFWVYYSGVVYIVGAMIAALHHEKYTLHGPPLPASEPPPPVPEPLVEVSP